eukprot:CAMPEP_0180242388 /NCGR_PEP_ID=MMETSP0987-20121128/33183_1 /TAXON_ID=697907 /ORGANISM="non described non described, Strain CCMP2293" /LENGTH=74 /DNA_ID=CAMNT_0022209471 /DNA_START=25 /DNA_END=250 /DNA_ORIENTATION=-
MRLETDVGGSGGAWAAASLRMLPHGPGAVPGLAGIAVEGEKLRSQGLGLGGREEGVGAAPPPFGASSTCLKSAE